MPGVRRARKRKARSVRITYKNPAVETRGGKLTPGTLHLHAEHLQVELHTIYGVASILHRSPVRIQQLCERGQLQAYKIGRDWIIVDNDLQEFIRTQQAKIRSRYGAFLEGN